MGQLHTFWVVARETRNEKASAAHKIRDTKHTFIFVSVFMRFSCADGDTAPRNFCMAPETPLILFSSNGFCLNEVVILSQLFCIQLI